MAAACAASELRAASFSEHSRPHSRAAGSSICDAARAPAPFAGQLPASASNSRERVSTRTFWLQRLGRRVEEQQHLAPGRRVEPRDREQPRLVRASSGSAAGRASAPRGSCGYARARRSPDRADGRRSKFACAVVERGAEQRVLVVARDLASRTCPGAHPGRRPCRRNPARRRIDRRHAAQRQQHRVAEHVARCSTSSAAALGIERGERASGSGRRHDCRVKVGSWSAACGAALVERRRRGTDWRVRRCRRARRRRRRPRARRESRARSAACRRACSPRVCAGSISLVATSPKMWKFGMPSARARASMAGTNFCQNSGLTCCAVSMRKPSTRYLSIQPQ